MQAAGFSGDYEITKGTGSSRPRVRMVYDGVRHVFFVWMRFHTGVWSKVMQVEVNLEAIFGTNLAGSMRMGFTAATAYHYYSHPRIFSLTLRKPKLSAAKSRVLENGQAIGSLQDTSTHPFRFTVDGKDACGHDRAVGGESITVRLILINSSISKVVDVPDSCSGSGGNGVCASTVTSSVHASRPTVGGLFEVRFMTDTAGRYNVEISSSGSTSIVATIEIVE